MNGNGELTETENVIFYVNYGILTDERILTYFAYENGYGKSAIRHKHSFVRCVCQGRPSCGWTKHDASYKCRGGGKIRDQLINTRNVVRKIIKIIASAFAF